MSSALNDLRVTVTDLVDRPGTSRPVDLRLGVPEGLVLALAEVVEPLRFTGVLESVVDGILLRGTLAATLRVECARCLKPMQQGIDVEVIELFSPPGEGAEDPPEEGYELAEGTLDLDTLLRDSLVPAIPYRPLCDPDCKGLCSVCGADRNEVECHRDEAPADPRWEVLQSLELPEDRSR